MPDPVVTIADPAVAKALEQITKVRMDVGASIDLPFLKPIFEYTKSVRETMDKDLLKRLDTVWVQWTEDSYAIFRKMLVDLKILAR